MGTGARRARPEVRSPATRERAVVDGTGGAGEARGGRSPAQWFCLVVGALLVLIGLLGFFVEAKFDTSVGGDPGQIDGENFLFFEVNGWHNLVHLLSGAVLLFAAFRHAAARTAAIVFGMVYLAMAVIGMIDGHDLFGVVPIDPADNVLHLLLGAAGLAAGLLSRPRRIEARPAASAGSVGSRRRFAR
jgi:Domain of unknown function (DUF4383)